MKYILLPLMGAAFVWAMSGPVMADDVKVCTDRSSYPTKVVVVCSTCQCPPGYY